jgi:hypothetical protein
MGINRVSGRRQQWVKTGKAQSEQKTSASPPKAGICAESCGLFSEHYPIRCGS